MAVTPADVAVELARPAPEQDSLDEAQWQRWINKARIKIKSRLGDLDLLDQEILDDVVTSAVAAHVRRPDDATQVEVSVDDARVSKRYTTGSGEVTITNEWWGLLSPAGRRTGYSVRMRTSTEDDLPADPYPLFIP